MKNSKPILLVEDDRIDAMIFERAVKELGINIRGITETRIYMPTQKHTGDVIELDPDMTDKEADAVITDRHDVIIGVKTADCVPILLYETHHDDCVTFAFSDGPTEYWVYAVEVRDYALRRDLAA